MTKSLVTSNKKSRPRCDDPVLLNTAGRCHRVECQGTTEENEGSRESGPSPGLSACKYPLECEPWAALSCYTTLSCSPAASRVGRELRGSGKGGRGRKGSQQLGRDSPPFPELLVPLWRRRGPRKPAEWAGHCVVTQETGGPGVTATGQMGAGPPAHCSGQLLSGVHWVWTDTKYFRPRIIQSLSKTKERLLIFKPTGKVDTYIIIEMVSTWSWLRGGVRQFQIT